MIMLENLPKLGYGGMRLPMLDNQVDHAALDAIVDEALRHGVNYFDTGYLYLGGESEKALKSSLVDRYPRDAYIVADKIPAWVVESREDMDEIFAEQQRRTGLEYFDLYLLHSLEESHMYRYENKSLDFWGWAQSLKEKGLIHHFGFSYHDTPEMLDDILTAHPEVEFVQLQVNYLDWENPIIHAGRCCEVAHRHNTPIIIMEPVRGGALASIKPDLEARMKAVAPERSIASWAMRFCLSLEGVLSILSGMSTLEQLRDNIATVQYFMQFTEAEKECLAQITKELLAAPTIGCTACRYCTDTCPAKIDIPDVISAYNTVLTYGNHDRPHYYYRGLMLRSAAASSCTKCKKCESLCPQHLNIVETLEKASAVFDA